MSAEKIRELLIAYENFKLMTPQDFRCSDECIDTFLEIMPITLLGLFNVVAMLPSDDEIEEAAKEEADRLHQFGDDVEWYARSLGFIDGAEFMKNKVSGN
jgi:hypothetical protein